jgi:hypothetical protein
VNFHGAGPTDLFVTTQTGPAILVGDGTGTFQAVAVTGFEPSFPITTWTTADVNGDGLLDVVALTQTPPLAAQTFLGDGRGGFHLTTTASIDVASTAGTLAVADLDGDGVPDLVVAATASGQTALFVLHGNGDGSFGSPGDARAFANGSASELRIADVDADGRKDVFLVTSVPAGFGRYAVTGTVYWGDGARNLPSSTPAGTLVDGTFTLADVDGDGRPDVVGTCADALTCPGPVTSARRSLAPRGLSEPIALTNVLPSVQAADLDGDGRPDLVPRGAYGPVPVVIDACDGSPYARSYLVPAVLSVSGVGSARFTSDLVLTNRGATDVDVDLTFTASLGGGGGSARLALPRGRHRFLDDAIAQLRSLGIPIPEGAGHVGSLLVRFSGASSPSAVSAQARTTSPYANGEVGVGFAPLPLSEGLTRTSRIALLRETADMRTNLALVSLARPGDGGATLRVRVSSTDASHPGSVELPDVTLAPGQFVQLDRVLVRAGLGASSGWCRVDRVAGDAAYAAYAVLNDNVSGDGSIVPAVGDWPRDRPFLPVVTETDSYTTEIVLTNVVSTDRVVHVTFRSPAVPGPSHEAGEDLVVPASSQLSLTGYTKRFCQAGPAPCVGPLVIDAVELSGLLVVALTRGTGAGAHEGVVIPGSSGFGEPVAAVWLDGLRQDDRHRSNVGLLNPGVASDARYRLEIFDGESGALAATVDGVNVGSEGWTQLNGILPAYAPGTANAYVRVTRTDPDAGGWNVVPPLAYAVVNDGASPGLGTGDGTYVPAR